MAWTAPMTAIAGSAFTAAQFNTYVRDNLLETAPAKATTAGGYFVATGTNAISQRTLTESEITTAETTSNTSYINLATVGPTVTTTTGSKALVMWCAQIENTANGGFGIVSVDISGATTQAANDGYSLVLEQTSDNTGQAVSASTAKVFNLTPGSNTFTLKYRASGGGTSNFSRRRLIVLPF